MRPEKEQSSTLLTVSALEVGRRVGPSSDVILDKMSFALRAGEVAGLLGESGCGKTTAALSILNLLPASFVISGGRVDFCGKNLLELAERKMQSVRGAQISMIFQEPGLALNPVMNVGTQVMEVMRAHLPWKSKKRRQATQALLEQLDFKEVDRIFHSYPHQLSGGQCQRVLIAQALACKPSILIADEPTASLDMTTQAEILALLKRLRKEYGLAMLFITHDPALLVDFADRVLVMQQGRVIEEGPTEKIFNTSTLPFTRAIVQSAQRRAMAAGA